MSAASACLAAFHKQLDLWKQAESHYDQARTARFGYTCGDDQAFLALEAIVAAHRAGVAAFTRKDGGGAGCPILERTSPDRGSPQGGYEITVFGQNLHEGDAYYWCGREMRVGKTDGKSFRVTVPPKSSLGDSCDTADLRMAYGYRVRWEAFFTYVNPTPKSTR